MFNVETSRTLKIKNYTQKSNNCNYYIRTVLKSLSSFLYIIYNTENQYFG